MIPPAQEEYSRILCSTRIYYTMMVHQAELQVFTFQLELGGDVDILTAIRASSNLLEEKHVNDPLPLTMANRL